MKLLFTVYILCFINISISAQGKSEPSNTFGINFKGFVKTDVFYDTRQNVTIREGHFLLYPQPELLDTNGADINGSPNLNMLSIQTRLTGLITAPDFLGAKTSGMVEGAFFGHSDGDINGFRLRHAFLKLDWEKTSLLVGQFWHPIFTAEVFPEVVSFNTGVPFEPFSRNPQIRIIQKFNLIELSFTAASQRDFPSTGPSGTSSVYLRNSGIPILNFNFKYKSGNNVAGVGVNFLSLQPRLVTEKKYKTNQKINSLSFVGFGKFVFDPLTIKLHGIYGENLTDLTLLGGYAVKNKIAATGEEEYTNLKTISLWSEIIYGKELAVALFAGYTENLGAPDDIVGAYYSRGNNIKSVLRVSPRVQYKVGNVQFAAEVEYTSAAYGTPDIKGKVINTKNVQNIRTLISSYLFF
jgi:hypothetical protein